MKLHSFQELVSRIIHLSTRSGHPIPISWSGTNAYTNSLMVNLPALPAGSVLTPHQFSVWLGYTLHEGPGHQTHTDLNLYAKECTERNDPQFSYLLNILEDIRIERADITLYPGDRRHLDAVHQFVDDQIPSDKCQAKDLMGLIYKHVFVHYRNLDTHRIQGDLDPNSPITQALTKLPLCKSTQDCINLADEIQKLLPQDDSRPKGGGKDELIPNPGEDTDNEDQPEANREGMERWEREGSLPEGMENPPSDENGNTDTGQSDPSNHDGTSRSGDSDRVDSTSPGDPRAWEALTEVKNLIQALAQEITKDNNPDQRYIPSQTTHEGNSVFPPVDISLDQVFVPSQEDMETFLRTRSLLSPQILALKKMFRIHLQATAKKSWLRGLDDGDELDKERLHLVPTGTSSIFKSHHDRRLINTAIELMVDLSSSMDITTTRSATIVLAEALSTIPQIKLSISGFTTNGRRVRGNFDYKNSGRIEGMDIFQFKSFDTPYLKSRARLGAIDSHDSTPLGDAYGKALEHLLPRPEPRRIIFLVTDGHPAFNKGYNHSDYLLMGQIHSRAKRLGIESLGIGIGNVSEFLKSYVDTCIIINDIPSLPRELMAALKGVIR